MRWSISASFTLLLALNLLNFFCDAVRLIREQGFRGNTYFYHTGEGSHAYHYQLETQSSIYFKCVQAYKLKCGGRAVLRLGGNFRTTQPHNHRPSPDLVGERHFRANVLNQVRDARYVSFQDILDEARRNLRYSRRVRSRMNMRKLRTPMYRARMASFPPLPQTLRELTQVLLQNPRISKTVDGEQNIYAGSIDANDGSHHVLFVSPRMREVLQQVTILQGDGTFRARPSTPPSAQCFTLVTTYRDAIIPIAWVLMERKSYEGYMAVFRLLKHLCPNLNPEVVITDWEAGQQRAWRNSFPNATIQGCLWHLGRAFIKKARALGLLRYRHAFPDVLEFIRKACAISLLPDNLYEEAMDVLKRRARNVNLVSAYLVRHFFTYVETKWLGMPHRRSYMNFWRCVHRTNNSCESHNRMLRKAVGAYRPNVYAFIEALSRLEHNADLDYNYMRNEGGDARPARRWKSVYTDRRLEALSNDLEEDIFHNREETIWNFLQQGSRLIEGAMNDHVQREVAARRRRPAQ
ncbi:uncharacterized protein LOC117653153 [Thrips palmi]|uniref:Uncharacterized protein LOC117653153 n=1 Tax=Thrips palmi TaxID=161013 RepID=A0A6P9AFX1_THRPL|nr:uncharacterized protein LOC117653153 [Thrips palmi]